MSISHIMIMANLKLVSFIYDKYQPTDKEVVNVKLDLLRIFGYKKITEWDLEQIEKDFRDLHNTKSRLPKKGHYVNAFIEMGFTHQTIGEWFEMTPAAVSWHKQNPPKSEYTHKVLTYLRMLDNGEIKERVRDQH